MTWNRREGGRTKSIRTQYKLKSYRLEKCKNIFLFEFKYNGLFPLATGLKHNLNTKKTNASLFNYETISLKYIIFK